MKYQIIKDLKKAIVLLIFVSFVVSCSMDEIYSCDREINMWVKSNLTEIKQMSSEDFLAIGDLAYQKAAYAAMEKEQRHKLWMDKLNDVLQMGWEQKEVEHIDSLISFIGRNESLFTNSQTQEKRDLFELFMYLWVEYAEEVLCWDRETIFSICGVPNKVVRIETQNGNTKLTVSNVSELKSAMQSPTIKSRGECACASTSDWCDIFGEIPVVSCNSFNYSCENTQDGCGLFWRFPCDGICKASIA